MNSSESNPTNYSLENSAGAELEKTGPSPLSDSNWQELLSYDFTDYPGNKALAVKLLEAIKSAGNNWVSLKTIKLASHRSAGDYTYNSLKEVARNLKDPNSKYTLDSRTDALPSGRRVASWLDHSYRIIKKPATQ
jgi:hypothetical protein